MQNSPCFALSYDSKARPWETGGSWYTLRLGCRATTFESWLPPVPTSWKPLPNSLSGGHLKLPVTTNLQS